MNMPDGSTPVPQLGGGDVNGTLATSILIQQSGSGAGQIEQPPKLVFQTTMMGVPSVAVAQEMMPVTGSSTLGLNYG